VQPRPDLDELRAVCQPESTMSRRNAEHWAARLWLRKVSLPVTAELVRTPVSANQLTVAMIVVGLVAAVPAALAGWWTAVLAAVLVLVYFLLDLCDGEVARWRRQTSVTGVYLDRVGHYVVEAALLTAYGVRAGGQQWGMWSTLGVLTALLAVIVKAETDLVDASRARAGMPVVPDAAAEPRSEPLAKVRRAASLLRVHQITGALESSLLLVVAASYDALAGGLVASKVFAAAMLLVAGTMAVLHLVSILASRRLS
jgi:phosphatidylglycerophosphate synthase